MSSLPPISSRNLLRQHPYREQMEQIDSGEPRASQGRPAPSPKRAPRGFINEDKRDGAEDIRMAAIIRRRGGPGVKPGGVRKRPGPQIDVMRERAKESDCLRRFFEAAGGPTWANSSNWAKLLLQLRKPDGTPIELDRIANMAPTEIRHFRDGHGLRAKHIDKKRLPPTLTTVIELRFPSNNLTGTLPTCVSELTHLRVLDFRENRLTGPIPNFIGTVLHELRSVDMSFNDFEGRMPVFGMRVLSFLRTIRLHDNRIGGEMHVLTGNLTSLRTLAVHNNRIRGTLPRSMTNLINLTECTFHNNLVEGQLPASWGERMPHLRMLTFANNRLTGPIPIEPLLLLDQLVVLQLDRNRFDFNEEDGYGANVDDVRSYLKKYLHQACGLTL